MRTISEHQVANKVESTDLAQQCNLDDRDKKKSSQTAKCVAAVAVLDETHLKPKPLWCCCIVDRAATK